MVCLRVRGLSYLSYLVGIFIMTVYHPTSPNLKCVSFFEELLTFSTDFVPYTNSVVTLSNALWKLDGEHHQSVVRGLYVYPCKHSD